MKILKSKRVVFSLAFLACVTLLAIAAPWVTQHRYDEQNIEARLQKPSSTYWFGTDQLGRDLYSRIVYGARLSLAVGFFTAVFALVLGTLTGAIAGYFGGRIDHLLMRLVDLFYMFPLLLLAILLGLLLGRGVFGIFLAIGFATWVTQARLVRAMVLQIREQPFVEAARALGRSHFAIILRHILPNIMGPLIVSLTFQIPTNILTESFLSFVGLGLRPPYSSWGTLASEGFRAMYSYPHLILFPGVVLFLTMLALNYLGEGLRDALDPHFRNIK